MTIVNNVTYSWSMIALSSAALRIDKGSTTLEGMPTIKWSKKHKVESGCGMGGRLVSREFGSITYTTSITTGYATQRLLRSVRGLLLEVGGSGLIINFANPTTGEDWTTTTVILRGYIFAEDCLESQQDDISITREFDLNPFDIQVGSGDTIWAVVDVTFEEESFTRKDEWLTPPCLLRRLRSSDLDPCSPVDRPWDTVRHHYTTEDDGP